MPRTLALEAAGRTDIGRARTTNQDALLVRPDLGLFVVADGLGGHAAGDVASCLAVAAIEGFLEDTRAASQPELPCPANDMLALLVAALLHANRRIHDSAANDSAKRGMGTTVVAALVRGNTIGLAHVGDSRISRFRDGHLEQLTEDHTVCNSCITEGVAPALAAKLPTGAALTRALGTRRTVDVTARMELVRPGDVLLMTTDGIHRGVEAGEIAGILAELGDLDTGVEQLITSANDRGGRDNSTALLVRWPP